MNDQTHNAPESLPAVTPAPKPESKASVVNKLLKRPKGATIDELMAATTWQPHSVRAFLSGLRKKGTALIKEQRKSGEQAYRFFVPIRAL